MGDDGWVSIERLEEHCRTLEGVWEDTRPQYQRTTYEISITSLSDDSVSFSIWFRRANGFEKQLDDMVKIEKVANKFRVIWGIAYPKYAAVVYPDKSGIAWKALSSYRYSYSWIRPRKLQWRPVKPEIVTEEEKPPDWVDEDNHREEKWVPRKVTSSFGSWASDLQVPAEGEPYYVSGDILFQTWLTASRSARDHKVALIMGFREAIRNKNWIDHSDAALLADALHESLHLDDVVFNEILRDPRCAVSRRFMTGALDCANAGAQWWVQ